MADDVLTDLMNEEIFGPKAKLPQFNAPPSGRREVRPVGSPQPDDTNSVDYLIERLATLLRDTAFSAAQPAHNEPHYWSTPLDLSGRITVPAAAAAPGVYQTAISYIVAPGDSVRVTAYGVNVLDPLYSYDGSLVFRIQVNGRNKYSDLANWTIQRGSIVLPRWTVMNLVEGDQLTFQVRRDVAAGAPQDVDFCLVGYTWQPRRMLDGARASIVYQG